MAKLQVLLSPFYLKIVIQEVVIMKNNGPFPGRDTQILLLQKNSEALKITGAAGILVEDSLLL